MLGNIISWKQNMNSRLQCQKANVFLTQPPNLFHRHVTSTFFMLLSELLRLLYGFIA